MSVPYRKVYEVIGVTSNGAFFCLPCVESLGVAESDDLHRPVFLGDDHEGFYCDWCGVSSSEL